MKKGIVKKNSHSRDGSSKVMVLYILPFLILCLLFCYFPLHGWIYAFFDYKPPLKLSQCDFVGFQWFKVLFSSPTQVAQMIQVMKNTFIMSLLGIASSILPLFFAILLNEINSGWYRKIVQTLTTLPNFISWVLVYAIAFSFFASDGMINNLLMDAGIINNPIKFLDTDKHVYLAMILWQIWKTVGWNAIMYMASLSGIDPELYDAAKVDGAGRFQLMRHITLPSLLPTFFVLLMLSVANFLNNGMDQYYVFQNAFNKDKIQVLDLYVYNVGMTGGSVSLATVISMLKSVVSVTLLTV
ncbi:MAG: ABC transporter permease subunit, partial [Oliverpabstia sp.]